MLQVQFHFLSRIALTYLAMVFKAPLYCRKSLEVQYLIEFFLRKTGMPSRLRMLFKADYLQFVSPKV